MTRRRHPRLRPIVGTLNLVGLIFMLMPTGIYLGARSDREELRALRMVTPPFAGALPPVTIPRDSNGSFFSNDAYFRNPRLAIIHLDSNQAELIVDGVTRYSSTAHENVLDMFAEWHEEQRSSDTLVFSSLRADGKITYGAFVTALDRMLHVDGIHFFYGDSIPVTRARSLAQQLRPVIDKRRRRGPSKESESRLPAIRVRRPSFPMSRELSFPRPLQSILDGLNPLPETEEVDSIPPRAQIEY